MVSQCVPTLANRNPKDNYKRNIYLYGDTTVIGASNLESSIGGWPGISDSVRNSTNSFLKSTSIHGILVVHNIIVYKTMVYYLKDVYMSDEECLNEINLDNQCCFALYAATRAVLKSLKPYLDTLGVTYPQYLVLLVLWESSPATVGHIAQRLFLDTGTITPLLKRMAENGLITRERSTKDERIVYVHLTEKGWKLKEHAVNMPLNMLNKETLTEERFYRLREELFSIIHILQE